MENTNDDDRWIVEEREDGQNVNNWHWMERDMIEWSRDMLTDFIKPLKHKKDDLNWSIETVDIDGVASVCVRKGILKKIIDLEVKLSFIITINEYKLEGNILIEDITYDSYRSAPICITVDLTKKHAARAKSFIENDCVPFVKEKINTYIKELDHFVNNIKLPKKETNSETTPIKHKIQNNCSANTLFEPKKNSKSSLSNIYIKEQFTCSNQFLFEIFTDHKKIECYTRSSAIFEPKKSFEFNLIGGNIVGKITDLKINDFIEMTWRFKDWPSEIISTVRLTFQSEPNGSELIIDHKNILSSDEDRVRSGWMNIFILPAKHIFQVGFGLH